MLGIACNMYVAQKGDTRGSTRLTDAGSSFQKSRAPRRRALDERWEAKRGNKDGQGKIKEEEEEHEPEGGLGDR